MKKTTNLTILLICYAAIIVLYHLSGAVFSFWFVLIFAVLTEIQAILFFTKGGSLPAKTAGIILISIVKLIIPAIYEAVSSIMLPLMGLAGAMLIYAPFKLAFMIVAFVFEVKLTKFMQAKHA